MRKYVLHFKIPLGDRDRFALVDVPGDISEAEVVRLNRVLATIAVPDDWSAATSNTSAAILTTAGGGTQGSGGHAPTTRLLVAPPAPLPARDSGDDPADM